MTTTGFSWIFFMLLLLFPPHILAATTEDWRDRAIYQIVTDRFATSDETSPSCNTTNRQYCGGSWKGVTNKLDYIQAMGFDAIWISPVVKNIEEETAYGEAYHGYWTQDINTLNSHFGTADDLKALSSALHNRKMFLMVDVVVNHFGSPSNSSNGGLQTIDFSPLSPFSSASKFHAPCLISDYTNQTDVEQCWLGDDKLPLPDLNTEDNDVVETMNTWVKNLVTTYNIDGLRIDTVKHVRKDFWPSFVKSAGVFSTGEVFDQDVAYTTAYSTVIDSVLDYPTFFAVTQAFSSTKGNLSQVSDVVQRTQGAYNGTGAGFSAGSFLENHDQPRFQSLTSDQALVKNAVVWPFVNDGIPILYYGQEQGFTGGNDPNNREAFWVSSNAYDGPLVAFVKTLNAARKAAIVANPNFLTTNLKFITQPTNSTTTLVVSKPPLLTLLTNAGNASTDSNTTWFIPLSSGLVKVGDTLVDVLTCEKLQVSADGDGKVFVVASKGGEPRVLLPSQVVRGAQAAAKGSPSGTSALCAGSGNGNGVVTSGAVGGASDVVPLARMAAFGGFVSFLFLL